MAQPNNLSRREQEVVKLLREGKSNKLIASSLTISERTVEFHLRNIFAKYQVSSRIELILKLGESTAAAQPGESTVADREENSENRDRLNQWDWSSSFKKAVSKIGKEFSMDKVMNSNTRNGSHTMTFFGSIRTCFIKYAEFNGRASRSEFWWFTLFILLVASALMYISKVAGDVFLIAVLLPFLAAGARRLHDIGKSGWWQLFMLAPIAGLVVVGMLWAQPPTHPQPDDTLPA